MASESNAVADDDRFDGQCGVTLAIFASILAIMELGGSYADYGMEFAQAEKVNAYAWYNSKGIKQNLAEGQRDSLQSLLAAGVIADGHAAATRAYVAGLQRDIERYEREKDEILRGSAAVGKAHWMQELDGERGRIFGAKQWAAQSDAYGNVTQVFDLGNLFLQICLVVGAISLVVRSDASRQRFYRGAIGLGITGTTIGLYAVFRYFQV
jgi:hypothetical protein